jgi:lipopolysaccharide transport system permease protein
MGFIAWFIIMLIFHGLPPITIVILPILLIPLIFISLGFSWIVSSLGVYFKDVGQFIGIIVMLLMFSSPVFYSIESIPEKFKIYFEINPIALTIDMVRDVAIFNKIPSISTYFLTLFLSVIIAYMGYKFFKKSQKGFSDVL